MIAAHGSDSQFRYFKSIKAPFFQIWLLFSPNFSLKTKVLDIDAWKETETDRL